LPQVEDNMKLFKDFGVSAWLGTLLIVGAFVIIGIGVKTGQVTYSEVLPMLGAWVGAVVAAYFVVKGIKSGKD